MKATITGEDEEFLGSLGIGVSVGYRRKRVPPVLSDSPSGLMALTRVVESCKRNLPMEVACLDGLPPGLWRGRAFTGVASTANPLRGWEVTLNYKATPVSGDVVLLRYWSQRCQVWWNEWLTIARVMARGRAKVADDFNSTPYDLSLANALKTGTMGIEGVCVSREAVPREDWPQLWLEIEQYLLSESPRSISRQF